MRLLTHNTMRNNTQEAKGKGFPLKITAVEVKVIDQTEASVVGDRELDFVKRILPTLEWPALVQVCVGKIDCCWISICMLYQLISDGFILIFFVVSLDRLPPTLAFRPCLLR